MAHLAGRAAGDPVRLRDVGGPPVRFWLGDWEIEQRIRQADGSWLRLPARTSVTSVLGGCALLERWEGVVRFYWGRGWTPSST